MSYSHQELMSDLETRTSLRLCGLPQDFNGQMLKDRQANLETTWPEFSPQKGALNEPKLRFRVGRFRIMGSQWPVSPKSLFKAQPGSCSATSNPTQQLVSPKTGHIESQRARNESLDASRYSNTIEDHLLCELICTSVIGTPTSAEHSAS